MSKILIAYYSQSGMTKRMAEIIKKKTNADIYEIIPIKKYDDDMWKTWDEAQKERANGTYPELINELPNISKYDVILVGGGVWGYTLSNPVDSFMQKMDFQGKRVSAFWTFYEHDEKYNIDMKKKTKNGKYIDGLALPRSLISNNIKLNERIDNWIKQFEV